MLDEDIASLIGGLYDTALDPSRWSDVLRQAARHVGGINASLFSKDASSQNGMVYHDAGGMDPSYPKLYFDKYATFDPLTTGHVLAAVDQPISTADIMPYDAFEQTRIYRELVRPHGIVDCAVVVLDKSEAGAAMFGVFRGERYGRVDDAARRRLGQIAPHVRRALMIGRVMEARSVQAATFADALDGLSAGTFLVDDAGRIVHANARGHAMAADGAALRIKGGRFAAADARAGAGLQAVLNCAGAGDSAVGRKGIALPLTGRDGEPYAAHVLPLTAGERQRAGARYGAVAAVFLRKATLEGPAPAETIARRHGLTPTELRVLLAIVHVGGVPETAEALGLREGTVKTHLHRLFRKTRTTRQADLVKLVAAFTDPLVG